MSSTTIRRKPEQSASAIFSNATSGYHILKIGDYSHTKGTPNGEFIKSHPFTVGGHHWCIRYYPSGKGLDSADCISFFLFLDESVTKVVKTQHKFSFIDEVKEETPSLKSEEVCNFMSYKGWGTARFIERDALEKSKHLKDDSFVVRCDIAIINEFRTEEMDEATLSFVSVPPSNLHQHLGDLLQTEKGADVVFQVGRESFSAHRCVLGARSPVFSAQLFGAMKESCTKRAIRIDDMEAHVFKALLHFVYTDSLPEMNKEEEDAMSQHLLVAADRYNLERLKLVCEHKLCKCIEASTLGTVLALAKQHHCHGLKEACFSFLSSPVNLASFLASDGFAHLNRSCPSTIKELIAKLCT